MAEEKEMGLFEFHGSATVGSHGQIVIPADVRRHLGIEIGGKLLIFDLPRFQGFAVMKAEFLKELASTITTHLGPDNSGTGQGRQKRKSARSSVKKVRTKLA